MTVDCYAIIPARGGSKRIPRKNIKDFHGRPLISYSIETALMSGIFKEVYVSTDDLEIAKTAELYGAKIPFIRSEHLSTDSTMTVPVVADAVARLHIQDRDIVCCIYPTAPLMESSSLIKGLNTFKAELNISYVCAVTDYPYPVQRALFQNEKGLFNMGESQYLTTRSQDLPVAFHDAGQFYFAYAQTWLEKTPMLINTFGVKLPRWSVQDLDTYDDWERLEIIYEVLRRSKGNSANFGDKGLSS